MIHNTETATDFPVCNNKIGQNRSERLHVKSPQTTTAHIEQCTASDKVLQLLTSLPVTSCFLALILSQGVSLSGDLWYINYMAVCVTLLTIIAIIISLFSVSSSNDFCENVFLTIYTPCSSLFGVQLNHRDVYEDEVTRKAKLAQAGSPAWLKHFLVISCTAAPAAGVSIQTMAYSVAVTITYRILSATLKTYKGQEADNAFQLTPTVTNADRLSLAFTTALVATDIACCPALGLLNLAYFVCTESTIVNSVESMVRAQNMEYMEGLDKYYTVGLLHLAEVALCCYIISSGYATFFMLPLAYFNIYKPVNKFRETVHKIKSESFCLSHFAVASATDIQQYDDVCAVCLSGMSHARVTPCKHIFHGKCLKDCMIKKPQCPMCQSQLL